MEPLSRDLVGTPASSETNLGLLVKALQGYFVRCEIECPDIPAEHVWWKFDFDVSEEKRDANSSESDSSAEWVPSCYLRAGLEDIGEF